MLINDQWWLKMPRKKCLDNFYTNLNQTFSCHHTCFVIRKSLVYRIDFSSLNLSIKFEFQSYITHYPEGKHNQLHSGFELGLPSLFPMIVTFYTLLFSSVCDCNWIPGNEVHIFHLLSNLAEMFLIILTQNFTIFAMFLIQIIAMEIWSGKEYLLLYTEQVIKEITSDSESELNEISDYKVDFDHDQSGTDDV